VLSELRQLFRRPLKLRMLGDKLNGIWTSVALDPDHGKSAVLTK
jgi:hypothetical protein